MCSLTQFKNKIRFLQDPFSQLPLRRGLVLIPLALLCFVLSPAAQAVLPPPAPDGGYPNRNTAEGTRALFNLTTGLDNMANGFEALFRNTTASFNTASGSKALHENTTGGSNTATGFQALFNNRTVSG